MNSNWNTLGKTKLIWSALCVSSSSPLHWLATEYFDERYKRKQSESFLSQLEHTIWVSRHRNIQFYISNIYIWVFFFIYFLQYILLANYKDFCKILFMYSFTHTNKVFLSRHLPTEIVIFKNVCYQMKCFNGDNFSFFRSRFC